MLRCAIPDFAFVVVARFEFRACVHDIVCLRACVCVCAYVYVYEYVCMCACVCVRVPGTDVGKQKKQMNTKNLRPSGYMNKYKHLCMYMYALQGRLYIVSIIFVLKMFGSGGALECGESSV